MRNHLFALAIAVLAPAGSALAFKGMTPPPPEAAPAAAPPAGEVASFAYFKPPLPDQQVSCPGARPADALLRAPLFEPGSGTCPVADAGGEVIPLADVVEALAEAHKTHGAGSGAKQDVSGIVERLVNARLIAGEARAMGMDEIPEVAEGLRALRQATAREILKAQVTQGVKPDPAQVERIYKDAVREAKIRSLLFAKEADAQQFVAAVKGGKAFEAAAKQVLADKKATGTELAEFVPTDKLLAPVAAAVSKLKAGGTSAPVKVPEGWAVVKVDAVRYPDNPTARANARAESLTAAKKKSLKKYYDELVKKYAKVDWKAVKKLDFQAPKPGFAALAKDQRVLATVEGSKPITVADVAASLETQYFHGIESAIREKKLNKQVAPTVDALLSQKLVDVDAARLKIPESVAYKVQLASAESGFLFGSFVERVIVPDIKVSDADAMKYYMEHKKEFTYPAFVKLQSIGFGSLKEAQAAAEKLRTGTDFKWLNANADGKLSDAQVTEAPPSTPLAVSALPEGLAKALQGAKRGDYRVYAAPKDQFYAIHVVDEIPAKEQPYEEAREGIGQKLFQQALAKSVDDWAGKLRKARPVQVFLVRVGN